MNAVVQPREHGLLFRGAMVRALLANRKTETRRPVAWSNSLVNGDSFPKRLWPDLDFARAWTDPGPSPGGNEGPYLKVPFAMRNERGEVSDEAVYRVYPRIDRGDRVWARETWYCDHCFYGDAELTTNSGRVGPRAEPDIDACRRAWLELFYFRADARNGRLGDLMECGDAALPSPWKSAIHLPRWAARILLDVADKTIPQRIGDITAEQKTAEGFPLPESDHEGPATFDEYFARIHPDMKPTEWCWAYRGLTRVT